MEQPASKWTDFHEIWYLSIFFLNLSRKIKFHYNRRRITGTLHEDPYIFLTISRSVLFTMRNVSGKNCRENQNTHLVFNNLVSKIVQFTIYSQTCYSWKYGACALRAGYLRLQTRIQNKQQRFSCPAVCAAGTILMLNYMGKVSKISV